MRRREILNAVLVEQGAGLDMSRLSHRIAIDILADVTDRRGWRHARDGCDDDIQAEIVRTWTTTIEEDLCEHDPASTPAVEALAALEHDQWAHWTRHMLTVLAPFFSTIRSPEYFEGIEKAREALQRWALQVETPYSEMSEKEKDSDREWAKKVLVTLSGLSGGR